MSLFSHRARSAVVLLTAVALAACDDRTTPEPSEPQPDPQPQPHRPRFSLSDAPVILVTNTSGGSVAGSLRAALTQATGGEVIRFDPSLAGAKITVDTTIDVQKFVTIEGAADKGIIISGGGKFQVLHFHGGATLVNVTITEGFEQTNSLAGAIRAEGAPLTLDHSTVSGNQPAFATIHADTVVLVNSTVANNIGTQDGAPSIFFRDKITVFNSTVAFNSGGIQGFSNHVTLHNAIIANNGLNDNFNCMNGSVDFTYIGKSISNSTNCGQGLLEMIVADPLLLPLADNGGPTQTLALSSGSPAINATDCDLTVDQRYVPRDAQCDIGAFELVFTTVTLTINPNAAVDPKTGAATVTGTVACSREETLNLAVNVKQDQRLRRVPTSVEATETIPFACGTSAQPWIALLSPTNGQGFENGAATGSVATANTPVGVTPSAASQALQLFWSHR